MTGRCLPSRRPRQRDIRHGLVRCRQEDRGPDRIELDLGTRIGTLLGGRPYGISPAEVCEFRGARLWMYALGIPAAGYR